MLCDHAALLRVDYQRNSLSATDHAELSAHLQQCEHCQREFAAMQQMNALLDREQQPSPQARTRFLAQLQQETAAVRPGPLAWLQQWWSSRPLGAFSYSAALLVAGVLSGQLLPPHSLGIGPQMAEVNAERLVQLCAVPPPPFDPVL